MKFEIRLAAVNGIWSAKIRPEAIRHSTKNVFYFLKPKISDFIQKTRPPQKSPFFLGGGGGGVQEIVVTKKRKVCLELKK